MAARGRLGSPNRLCLLPFKAGGISLFLLLLWVWSLGRGDVARPVGRGRWPGVLVVSGRKRRCLTRETWPIGRGRRSEVLTVSRRDFNEVCFSILVIQLLLLMEHGGDGEGASNSTSLANEHWRTASVLVVATSRGVLDGWTSLQTSRDRNPCTTDENFDGPGMDPEGDAKTVKGVRSCEALTGRRRPVEATESASWIDDGATVRRRRSQPPALLPGRLR